MRDETLDRLRAATGALGHPLATEERIMEQRWPDGYSTIGWRVRWRGIVSTAPYLQTAYERLVRLLIVKH